MACPINKGDHNDNVISLQHYWLKRTGFTVTVPTIESLTRLGLPLD